MFLRLELNCMNIRTFFVFGVLLLFGSVVYGGSYQRTRDGRTLVWRDVPARGDEATWSGRRDKNGFATGSGVLTWYKIERSIVTGSNILDTRRNVTISHYSGEMVRGKFKGAVTYVNANRKAVEKISGKRANRSSRRQKATRSASRIAKATPRTERTPAPSSDRIIVDTPELTSVPDTPAPAPEQSASPGAEEPQTAAPPETTALTEKPIATPLEPAPEQSAPPIAQEQQTAVPSETGALVAKQMATPPERQDTQLEARNTTAQTPNQPDNSLRSQSAPPIELPKPPTTIDEETVARLDTLYHSAVKANDAAIMDEILADDFVLVTDDGASLTKADLIKEAQEKRTTYEHQEVEEGTQKVRIWRDTAVVTALLRIKGTRDQDPFDHKVSVSETYVRTPRGWRYVFGQASKTNTQ